MRGEYCFYPGLQLAAWNFTKSDSIINTFLEFFEITDNSNPTRWATVIRSLLSHHAHCVPLPHHRE